MKKIKFKTILPDLLIAKPTNSNRSIPQWFRDFPRVINGVETVKACMPFLDALTTGYTLYLSADVYFENFGIDAFNDLTLVDEKNIPYFDATKRQKITLSPTKSGTGWFWKTNNLENFADAGDIKGMTKKINGGFIGLEEREKKYKAVLAVF